MLGYTLHNHMVKAISSQNKSSGIMHALRLKGEMIVLDGRCYRAQNNGDVVLAEKDRGVPFASVCCFQTQRIETLGEMGSIEQLKSWLTLRIEEDFGLNSMYSVRIDGEFSKVDARSESGTKAHHVTLKGASRDEITSVEQGKHQ